jgi:hypothetical protein
MSRIEEEPEFCFGGECQNPVRDFGDYCEECAQDRADSLRESMEIRGQWPPRDEDDGDDDLTELSDPRTWGYWEDRIK